MPKKQNKSTKARQSREVKALKQSLAKMAVSKTKKTPFANAGMIAGKSIGGMFGNAALGSGIGKWLGSGIGQIFGSGDYTMTNSNPSYNVLTNGNQIPKFSTTRQTNIVCHREYLGDIQGTAGFNLNSYPLNPGIPVTFPWLSTVASNYQEYKFHGVVFEFRSLITDFVTGGAPGVVIMSTNYNSDEPVYLSKQQMENAEFAVSSKPTVNLMHGIECADSQTILPQKFIRTGPVPAGQDLRLYDAGLYQFATQQNPIQDLGELWVSYCVEFFKPQSPPDVGGNTGSSHVYRVGVTAASPLGTIQLINSGDLGVGTITSSSLAFLGNPGQNYLVTVAWVFPSAAFTAPGVSYVGATALPYLNNSTSTFITAPSPGATTSTGMYESIIKCNLVNPGTITVNFGLAGVIPSGSVDILITEFSNEVSG